MARVGEAAHPGPSTWHLCAVNPTGVMGKGATFAELPTPAIHCVSETHLTLQGAVRFKQELKSSGSSQRFFRGAPVPPKSQGKGCIGGKHLGVGFMTEFPTRPHFAGWDTQLHTTARIHASRFMIGHSWVEGAVCYGFAAQSHNPEVRARTDALIHEISRQIHPAARGYKFVAGDFNQLPNKLAEPASWEEQGWIEVQDLAEAKWQVQPQATCKHSTRKDYIYVSPDLAKLIKGVQVQTGVFPDHSVLRAEFHHPAPPLDRFMWPTPQPIDPQQIQLSDYHAAEHRVEVDCQQHPTQQYESVCRQFEQSIHDHLTAQGKPGLHPSARGRASTTDRVRVSGEATPVKPPRQGDPSVTFAGLTMQHSRWFQQLKRLINLRNVLAKHSSTLTQQEQRVSLWHSIRAAAGFKHGFAQWRVDSQLKPPLPKTFPTAATAVEFLGAFQDVFQALDTQLSQQRKHRWQQQYVKDTNRIFRGVANPRPDPVQVLVEDIKATVMEVPYPNMVAIDRPVKFDLTLPVQVLPRPWI